MSEHDLEDVRRHVPESLVPPETQRDVDRRADYATRLTNRAERRGSLLCAGIDPSPASLELLRSAQLGTRTLHASAIERFAAFVIDAARDRAVAVKPQLAWFELAGAEGMRALERTVAYARNANLLVVLDAKRGDIAHSADAYARAWLGEDAESGAGGDALTINISLGADTLEAFTAVAHARACQVYALVHTSNPGAVALQGATLDGGGPWWHCLAKLVDEAGAGAVVGATQLHVLEQARQLMPTAPLLVPGVGTQGGSVANLAALASPQAAPMLINVARGLLPEAACDGPAFRAHVTARCAAFADETAALVNSMQPTPVGG